MSRRNKHDILFHNTDRPVIWIDAEMRMADAEPALTSVRWSGDLKTYVHDLILAESAKAKDLEVQPWPQFAADLVSRAIATNSVIHGYSLHERDLLMSACSKDAEWIDANYGDANAAKWFRKSRPELYAEACRMAGEGNKPGLKNFLAQPDVGYPFKKYLRKVQRGPILGRLRELLAKRDGRHRKLTDEAKRDWALLIDYNRQDVLGMIHLVEYVRREDGFHEAT